MSSAGMSGTSGTSDTERFNSLNDPANASGMAAGGMPDDDIEVVEIIETTEPVLSPDAALAFEQDMLDRTLEDAGFRWWYVPAIGLPVVVGTGAAIWYFTKGPQSFQDAYDLVTGRNKTAQAKRTARQGMRNVRQSAKNVSSQTEDLRERLADLWDDARDQVLDWWDTMTDRDTLEQLRGRADEAAGAAQGQLAKAAAGLAAASATFAAKQKAGSMASAARGRTRQMRGRGFDFGDWLSGLGAASGSWRARNQAQDLKNRAMATAEDLRKRARGQVQQAQVKGALAGMGSKGAVTATKASAPVAAKAAVTKAKTQQAAKKSGRQANRAWKNTRAFTFGMLVTATLTYIRTWRSRLDERNLRETAGGRMVRDA